MDVKRRLRQEARARRAAEPGREAKSRLIQQRVLELPAFRAARTVATYVGVADEVATADLMRAAWAGGARVAVPWRDGDALALFAVAGPGELEPAGFGLLEPSGAVRRDPGRAVDPASVDLVVVPGLAFDRRGGRLGHGKGYYDGLLPRCPDRAPRVALAFECQLVDAVPMGPRDQPMDLLVTERAVYQVSGRAGSPDR